MNMTFWRRDDFKALNREWRIKLKENGFEDLEDTRGNLKQKDARTHACKSPEQSREFFSLLMQYLELNEGISIRDRQILMLYAQGTYIAGPRGIVSITGWSRQMIYNIINHHKAIIRKTICVHFP